MKIKLLPYQVKAIRDRISNSYEQIEDMILEEYKVSDLSELNSSDYDAIIEDIQDWHCEMNDRYRE